MKPEEDRQKYLLAYRAFLRGQRPKAPKADFGEDAHTKNKLLKIRTAVTQKEAMGSLGQGLEPLEKEYKPSDVDPNITPGSKLDTFAMTKGGTGMRQTLHDPNPQRFMPPGYFAHLQNMQNMAAVPGQVRGGGMPKRQKRHAEKWAAFDQNVADRRQRLGEMNNMRKLQWLQQNAPAAVPEFMRSLMGNEEEEQNWIDPWGNVQPARRHA
jgi:hypothetical protein